MKARIRSWFAEQIARVNKAWGGYETPLRRQNVELWKLPLLLTWSRVFAAFQTPSRNDLKGDPTDWLRAARLTYSNRNQPDCRGGPLPPQKEACTASGGGLCFWRKV